jgi:hypothetical protein
MGTDWQTPPEQTPLGQALPQAPQCPGSEERSRQRSAAPQYSSPTAQSARTHSPPRHSTPTRPLSQTLPQAPQLLRSELRSTQTPLQEVDRSGGQTQLPLMQLAPAEQAS